MADSMLRACRKWYDLSDGKYETGVVKLVLQEVSNADPTEVAKEFERYENEFLIPPSGRTQVGSQEIHGARLRTLTVKRLVKPAIVAKKVTRFSGAGVK